MNVRLPRNPLGKGISDNPDSNTSIAIFSQDVKIKRKIGVSAVSSMIKNFSVPQYQNMVHADVFLRVLLRFLSARRSRAGLGAILAAACGGENGSRYFKNRAHLQLLRSPSGNIRRDRKPWAY
ncbi:hypothetical protein HY504_02855 [Candidatus Wolfebacteria bacterium]|nr:hypothetical protein [Candidatus Wolfebacteria bacterium]